MDKRTNLLLSIIVVLLVILLALNAYSVISASQRRALAEMQASAHASRARVLEGIIVDMMDGYNADVYDNPNIDRIAEQQLLAEEYQLTALQAIAIQNGVIIELLADSP